MSYSLLWETKMEDLNFVNNSGQGKNTEIPQEVKRFNWGAFFWSWIWGLFNHSYLTLISLAIGILVFIIVICLILASAVSEQKEFAALAFVLITLLNLISGAVNFGLSIWFGIKGNDWAWQNKSWKSLEHFHDVQRNWAIAGLLIIVVGVVGYVGIIAAMTLPALMMNTENVRNSVMIKKTVSTIQQAALINEALEKKCELSSQGLAACFGEQLIGSVENNKIELSDGNILEFTADGHCKNSNSCFVKIISDNVEEKIGLYIDKDGYTKISKEDSEKVIAKYNNK